MTYGPRMTYGRLAGLTAADIVRAAEVLEQVAALYQFENPSQVELSASWLREELPHIIT